MTTTVRAVSDVSVPGAGRTNGHSDRGIQNNAPGSRMTYSRLIGALFLVGFLFYGVGAALVTSVTGERRCACVAFDRSPGPASHRRRAAERGLGPRPRVSPGPVEQHGLFHRR